MNDKNDKKENQGRGKVVLLLWKRCLQPLGIPFGCLIIAGAFASANLSCAKSSREHQPASAESGFKKVKIHYSTGGGGDDAQMSLADYKVEFLGVGVFRNGVRVSASTVSGGSAELFVPVAELELRGTLVTYATGDLNKVFTSRFSQTIQITPDTESVDLSFPAYSTPKALNLVGVIYEENGKPAKDLSLSVADPHSGAVITLPNQSHLVRSDDRGVYSFRSFFGAESVRLRPTERFSDKEFVLKPDKILGEGWQSLPFLNLNGTDQQSPFEISLALLKGDKGDKGDRGEAGTSGGAGLTGSSAKVLQETESAGVNCASGGVKVSTWVQAPGTESATFNPASGSSGLVVRFVCNGAPASNAGTKLFRGILEIGSFVSGAKPYLFADSRYFTLKDASEPGGFNVDSTLPVYYMSSNCTGTAYLQDGTGRVSEGPTAYLAAQVIGGSSTSMALASVYRLDNNGVGSCAGIDRASKRIFRVGNSLASINSDQLIQLSSNGTSFAGSASNPFVLNPSSNVVTATNSVGASLLLIPSPTAGPQLPLQRSSDNGQTFSALPNPPFLSGGSFSSMFSSGLNFYVSSYFSSMWTVFKSADNGNSWTNLLQDLGYGSASIAGTKVYTQDPNAWFDMADDKAHVRKYPCNQKPWRKSTKLRCTDGTSVFESTNAEMTHWTKLTLTGFSPVDPSGKRVGVVPAQTTDIVVYPSSVTQFKISTDGGDSWSERSVPGFDALQDIDVSPDGSRIAVFGVSSGAGPNMVRESVDAGNTWSTVFTATGDNVARQGSYDSSGSYVFGSSLPGSVAVVRKWNGTALTEINVSSMVGATLVRAVYRCGTVRLCFLTEDNLLIVVDESNMASTVLTSSSPIGSGLPSVGRRDIHLVKNLVMLKDEWSLQSSVVFTGSAWKYLNSSDYAPLAGLNSYHSWLLPADGNFANLSSGTGGYFRADTGNLSSLSWLSHGYLLPVSTYVSWARMMGSQFLIWVSGTGGGWWRSVDSGLTYSAVTLPTAIAGNPYSILTAEGLFLFPADRQVSTDVGLTWQSSNLPADFQPSRVVKVGSLWYVSGDVSGSVEPQLWKSSDGINYARVIVPDNRSLHTARNVTLPTGAGFPLDVLKFSP